MFVGLYTIHLHCSSKSTSKPMFLLGTFCPVPSHLPECSHDPCSSDLSSSSHLPPGTVAGSSLQTIGATCITVTNGQCETPAYWRLQGRWGRLVKQCKRACRSCPEYNLYSRRCWGLVGLGVEVLFLLFPWLLSGTGVAIYWQGQVIEDSLDPMPAGDGQPLTLVAIIHLYKQYGLKCMCCLAALLL